MRYVRLPECALVLLAAIAFGASPALAAKKPALDPETVNAAAPSAKPGKPGKGIDPVAVRAGVMLGRLRFSPGVIDGRPGENLDKAVKAFQAAQGLNADGKLNADTWAKLTAASPDPVLVEYETAAEDVSGPFLNRVPPKMEAMAGLKKLGYTSARELLAEKFHMSEVLLRALNPGRSFKKAGETLVVANVAAPLDAGLKGKVARIEVEKGARDLKAFDEGGALVAFYPASIGSEEKPAPSGAFKVKAVARNPTYTYNPEFGFKGVKAKKKFTIAAGPNNPVGSVWIDLSAETYGIHGTPNPEKVGKTYSHGCVRLTNWDAEQLAALVKKGTAVEFKD